MDLTKHPDVRPLFPGSKTSFEVGGRGGGDACIVRKVYDDLWVVDFHGSPPNPDDSGHGSRDEAIAAAMRRLGVG